MDVFSSESTAETHHGQMNVTKSASLCANNLQEQFGKLKEAGLH